MSGRDRLGAAARAAVRRRASRIGHGSAAEGDDAPGFTLPSRGVVLLAILCLLVMVTEGAMADWGGLYLRQDLGASAALAALAYSFFTAGMTLGPRRRRLDQPPHRRRSRCCAGARC